VIDQTVGFLGGIDLCLGRWDTQEHSLIDYANELGECYCPGKDYNNDYKKGFSNVKDYQADSIDREKVPRMPWHDLHLMVEGESALDLARHFIEYWNHAKYDLDKNKDKNNAQAILRPTKTAKPIDFKRNENYKVGFSFEESGIFSDGGGEEIPSALLNDQKSKVVYKKDR
jgi:phospholipase D1/2